MLSTSSCLNVALEKSEVCLNFLLFNILSVCLDAPKILSLVPFLHPSLPYLFPVFFLPSSLFLFLFHLSKLTGYDCSGSVFPGPWYALLLCKVRFCLIYSVSQFLFSSLWTLNNYVYIRSSLLIVAVIFSVISLNSIFHSVLLVFLLSVFYILPHIFYSLSYKHSSFIFISPMAFKKLFCQLLSR